jgi:hypothetical protein
VAIVGFVALFQNDDGGRFPISRKVAYGKKQAEMRATKWNLISSYECLNQTDEMPSGPGDLVRRKDSLASFKSTWHKYRGRREARHNKS